MTSPATGPLVSFVIGGAQKSGTTALARYLARSPHVILPRNKEAHVFDSPVFDPDWSRDKIDALYRDAFDPGPGGMPRVYGDATPYYVFDPRCVDRIAAYNPRMRWIVLLREPADRALSHYNMERERGGERLPLWVALLLERHRIHRDRDAISADSSLRRHSYLARSRYARQLEYLERNFPPDQILLLASAELLREPAACVARTLEFLGLPRLKGAQPEYQPAFTGRYPSRHALTRRLLRIMLRGERRRVERRYGLRLD